MSDRTLDRLRTLHELTRAVYRLRGTSTRDYLRQVSDLIVGRGGYPCVGFAVQEHGAWPATMHHSGGTESFAEFPPCFQPFIGAPDGVLTELTACEPCAHVYKGASAVVFGRSFTVGEEQGLVVCCLESLPDELEHAFVSELTGDVVHGVQALVQERVRLRAERERNEATAALQESEERLRTLIDAMPDLVCFKDGEGRWLVANEVDLRLFELEGVDYRGLKDSELAPYSENHRDEFLACEASDEVAWAVRGMSRGEETITDHAAGVDRVFDIIKVPTFHDDGSRRGLVVVGRDITDRQQVEAALRSSERRFRLFMDHFPGAVSLHREGGVWVYRNTHHQERFPDGWPGDLERLAAAEAVVCDGGVSRDEARLSTSGGARTYQTLRFPVPEGDGALIGSISLDVTELRELEEHLRQSQKLESIGQLAAGVAHDFNNLLSVILGHGDLLIGALGSDDPRVADVYPILEASRTATELTRQLLAFGRKQVLEVRVLDLNGVVRGARSMLRRLVREDVVIRVRLSLEPLPVRADLAQLQQVLINLVLNAADALSEGGHIDIRTDWSTGPGGEACAVLQVEDDGIGMDEETRRQIFEPFFTTKGVGRGTGLGLATVHGVVGQHGGEVRVRSEPGLGSTFDVVLPVASEPVSFDESSSAGSLLGGGERVLVVEDAPAVRRLAHTILSRRGYRVGVAQSPHEALEIASARAYDLVLTDVVMPGMDGPTLAAALRRLQPQLRVLFMSGYGADVIADRGIDHGVQLLDKPFTVSALLSSVREALDS